MAVTNSMKAVRFHEYGGTDVLRVEEVERPAPGPGQVLVGVRAAGIQPGEAMIREGARHGRWPAGFPSGQGSDLAGVVVGVGPQVRGVAVGDEVLGFTHRRASHAEFVVVDDVDLTPRPQGLSWEAAGSLYVAGTTAYATVFAVDPGPGDTVVVSGAAGGVGSLAVQLARRRGATVIGLAGRSNHAWLEGHGIVPVEYGDGVAERIRQASGGTVDAFIDAVGAGYVDLAVDLGVRPERIDTIRDWAAAARVGAQTVGEGAAACAVVLGQLARLGARGELEVPIARTYPLARVRDAFEELGRGHTHGKIVLRP
jgi:NADPH:quinone reductase-like Zn-dependent oxidoreductase